MRSASARCSRVRGGLLAGLLLALATAPALAVDIERVDSVLTLPAREGSAGPAVFTAEETRRQLEAFVGAACDPVAIEEELARPYRFLGYVPTISVSCADGTLDAIIRESSHRIELIAFDPADLHRIGMTVRKEPGEAGPPLFPVPAGAMRSVLEGLLQTRAGDLYNHERYRSDSDALRRLGYVIAFVPGPPTGPDEYPVGAYLIQSLGRRPAPGEGVARERNYLGGTAAYSPRARVETGLVYQRRDLFGGLDRLTVAPSYNASIGGRIAYTAPWLIAREDPRRLYDLGVGVFSLFRNNRLLAGDEIDERRSGASVTLGARPLGMRAPHDLRVEFQVRHERVDLERSLLRDEEERLTFLSLRAEHVYRHTYRRPSLSLRIVPGVDVALDGAGGGHSFVRPEIDATLHARFQSGLEFETHLVGGTLDRQAPGFELWSLGGVQTVRGFREDSFLGRHMLALQTELWFPFVRTIDVRPDPPGGDVLDSEEVPFEPRIARLLKGAIFLDGGFLTGTADGHNEAILGAGVGLRFVVPRHPLVLRLDYGWGLGDRGGDSFPYLGLGYRF